MIDGYPLKIAEEKAPIYLPTREGSLLLA